MAFITVIIPTKDRPELLRTAVTSVMNQSFKDWELILVDDHSEASPPRLFETLQASKIKVVENKGVGRSTARNTGILGSTSPYICFLDDDDWLEINFLQNFVNDIPHFSDNAILRQSLRCVYQDGSIIQGAVFQNSGKNDTETFLMTRMVGMVTCCYPRSVFKDFLLDERFSLWEDTHFLLRVTSKYPLVQIPGFTYNYRIHDHMNSRLYMEPDRIEQSLLANLAPMLDYFDQYASTSSTQKWKSYLLSQKKLEYAVSDVVYGNGEKAFDFLKESLKHGFFKSHWRLYLGFFKAWVKKNLL